MDRKIAFLEQKINNLLSNNNITIPHLEQSNNQELFDKLANLEKKINDLPNYDNKLVDLEKKINDLPNYDNKLVDLEKKINDLSNYDNKLADLENKFNIILNKLAETTNNNN
jgi:DNA repair ATPase RecN